MKLAVDLKFYAAFRDLLNASKADEITSITPLLHLY